MAEQQSPVNSVAKPVKRERSPERDTAMTPELKYKVPKSELMSPADRHDERRRDARLYEMDRERRKVTSPTFDLGTFASNFNLATMVKTDDLSNFYLIIDLLVMRNMLC